ncbi:hypothetical protein ACFYNW_37385 [Streptomyces virginiae]|uniref:hypothetical protein n=1 Tax=Streptomyces virginiae TaxID=1961 RepID=UPI0036E54F05
MILVNCVILHSSLTTVPSVTAAFAKSGDAELRRIDVESMLRAAERGFARRVMPYLRTSATASSSPAPPPPSPCSPAADPGRPAWRRATTRRAGLRPHQGAQAGP